MKKKDIKTLFENSFPEFKQLNSPEAIAQFIDVAMLYGKSEANAKKLCAATILSKNGITIKIDGCGCCGSPIVSFGYKEVLILDSESDCKIDMIKSKQ